MAKKKTVEGEVKAPKAKSLFDHINEIRYGKNPHYFSTLTEADKKTWSNYMICRFLSMQPELVETVNDLQYYQDKLSPEHFYQVCIEIVPRRKGYWPYVKSQAEKRNKGLLTLLCSHFQDSERNVLEYFHLLSNDDLRDIISLYGYTEKDCEVMLESA